jgi:surface antigen
MGGPSPINPGIATNAASYIWGQCTYYVARTLSWVPAGLGNAKDWLANAQRKGFQTSSTPHAGDVVVYGPNALGVAPGTEFGHVAVVQSVQGPTRFTVGEMNVHGVGVADTRIQNGLKGVLGFIRPPATNTLNPTLPNLNPLDAIGSGFSNLGTSINTSISGAANTLNPANWLMTLWNDHIKGSLVRVALIIVGLWVLVIGLRMLFENEGGEQTASPGGSTALPQSQNKSSANTTSSNTQQDQEADASAAAEDAPEAAAVA